MWLLDQRLNSVSTEKHGKILINLKEGGIASNKRELWVSKTRQYFIFKDYFLLLKRFSAFPISNTHIQVKACTKSKQYILSVNKMLIWKMLYKLQIGQFVLEV